MTTEKNVAIKRKAIDQTVLNGGWSQTSLYLQVRTKILEAIRSGEWQAGDAIPPEKKLCEHFGISIGTLRKAVDELTSSGMLIRHQGRGTFVARHSHDRYLFFFFHLMGQDGHKEYPAVEFLKFQTTKADDYAAESLYIKTGAPLWQLTNRLSLRNEVVSLDEIYLSQALFFNLSEASLQVRQTTLYQMYQDDFGFTVMRAEERVRAVLATAIQARRLKIKLGTPLLQIVRIAYTIDNQPIELRYSFAQTSKCEYRPDVYDRDRHGI
jgi:GntR family transcriptional regulator